jgi:hypothetical protein
MPFRRTNESVSHSIATVASLKPSSETLKRLKQVLNRRRFLTGLGAAGATAKAQSSSTAGTGLQIFTAALIAEDLAITMYYNALVGEAIRGVEAEHRTLARAIPPPPTYNGVPVLPSDDLCYESTDTLQTVYDGMNSAAAALAPFLSSMPEPRLFHYKRRSAARSAYS